MFSCSGRLRSRRATGVSDSFTWSAGVRVARSLGSACTEDCHRITTISARDSRHLARGSVSERRLAREAHGFGPAGVHGDFDASATPPGTIFSEGCDHGHRLSSARESHFFRPETGPMAGPPSIITERVAVIAAPSAIERVTSHRTRDEFHVFDVECSPRFDGDRPPVFIASRRPVARKEEASIVFSRPAQCQCGVVNLARCLGEERQRSRDRSTFGGRHLRNDLLDCDASSIVHASHQLSSPLAQRNDGLSPLFGEGVRRTRFFATRRSQSRVAVDACRPRCSASSVALAGPRVCSTTSARICGSVTSASRAAIDRAATATSARDARSTASIVDGMLPAR